jgi:Xaa-Pro aminopeptidase
MQAMNTDPAISTDDRLAQALRLAGPMNLDRAAQVMARFDLEGLVLADPVNVFHVLGYWPQLSHTRPGQPPTTFALLARDPRIPPAIVTSRFVYYYTYADGGFERDIAAFLYNEVGDDGLDQDATPVNGDFPDRGRAALSPIERRRRQRLDAALQARASSSDSGTALVRAMRELGLWSGRIGHDHPLIGAVSERHAHPGTLVPADNILRWIRLVKSPLEIQLLRRAASANCAALEAVARSVRAGAGHRALAERFGVEAARRGNTALFLNVDRVSSEIADDHVADGHTLFVDGVSQHLHYHGDYARTVFVGDPPRAAREAARAAAHAWHAIRNSLRPGLRYSEIAGIGREALRRGGFDVQVGFGPHSVGLMHTDEPGEDAGGFYRKLDLTLEPGMVLSVDCPVMDTGLGGSAHIEDLMLITPDGAEPLHPIGEPFIVV